jgi:hypothetical protein
MDLSDHGSAEDGHAKVDSATPVIGEIAASLSLSAATT